VIYLVFMVSKRVVREVCIPC